MLRSATYSLGLASSLALALRPGLVGSTLATGFGSTQSCSLHSSVGSAAGAVEPPSVPKNHGSTVVLTRGGIESAALLAYWQHWSHGQDLHPLFVALGHKAEAQQLRAAQRLCQELGLELSVMNASMVGHELERGKVKEGLRMAPHRNLLLLSLAASFAAGLRQGPASHIALCLSQDDVNTYSSTSTAFLRHADALMATLEPPLQLLTPMARLSRWQIVKMGEQVGAPWKQTYACLEGKETHCGKCAMCEERREAFHRAGIEEPWGTYAT